MSSHTHEIPSLIMEALLGQRWIDIRIKPCDFFVSCRQRRLTRKRTSIDARRAEYDPPDQEDVQWDQFTG